MVNRGNKDQGMKVLLIRPPVTLLPNEIQSLAFPLGLAYVAASLESNGVRWRCWTPWRERARGQSPRRNDSLRDGLAGHRAAYSSGPARCGRHSVAHVHVPGAGDAYEVAAVAKRVDPQMTLVMGGAHASSTPEEVLAHREVDWVVLGEGESTMLKALANRDDPAKLREIKGFGCKIDNQIAINREREYIPDIDQIPRPAWHLFHMERYLEAEASHGPDLMRRPLASMITSRGCPCRCVDCAVHTVWGRSYRPRSARKWSTRSSSSSASTAFEKSILRTTILPSNVIASSKSAGKSSPEAPGHQVDDP